MVKETRIDPVEIAAQYTFDPYAGSITVDSVNTSPQPEEISERASVLREAESLITGDRNVSYGSPTQNFKNIAALWTTRYAHKLKDGEAFTGSDVADAMILLKVARNIAQPKRDNAVDLAGYAACGYEALLDEQN